jgi:hypothetical protein
LLPDVRSFPNFTRDLHALADWLVQCGIRSVAMEYTSVYWIPVYQILKARGLEVYFVIGLRVSISADSNVQFAGANINAGSIWMKDCSVSHVLLLFLATCSSDHAARTPGARAQSKLPIEIVAGTAERHHTSVRNPRPTLFGRAWNRHQCRRGL